MNLLVTEFLVGMPMVTSCGKPKMVAKLVVGARIQITLVLVFIFSRYWSKSIIRAPPLPPGRVLGVQCPILM